MLLRHDPASVEQAIAAANFMYRALRNMGCTCTHNVPYAGCRIPQVIVTRCARCRALAAWRSIEQDTSGGRE
jgi:hypothetical protein